MSENVNPAELQKTCLYDSHVALQAKMSPFAGFMMPIQYTNITDEHNAVRHHVGMFDVSHMGEIFVSGKDAERFVNHIFTNDIRPMVPGQILYGMLLYPNGGTVDDLLVYKEFDPDHYLLVVNAANIDKDFAWIQEQAKGFDVVRRNHSAGWGQIAVQGPEAEKTVVRSWACRKRPNWRSIPSGIHRVGGKRVIVSRTGYTGEDGFEIYATPEQTVLFWKQLLEAGVSPAAWAAATPCVSRRVCRCTVTNSAPTSPRSWPDSACSARWTRKSSSARRPWRTRRPATSPANSSVSRSKTRPSRAPVIRSNWRTGPRSVSSRPAITPSPGEEHLLRPREQGVQRPGYPAVGPHPQENLPRQGGQKAFLSDQLQEIIINIQTSITMSKVLEGLLYSESHEWVKVEGDIAVVGVSDFAQKEMGNITYVDLPDVEDEVAAGEDFGALESVKAASDLIIPCIRQGRRGERGPGGCPREDQRGRLRDLDHQGGDERPAELDALMDAAAYKAIIQE